MSVQPTPGNWDTSMVIPHIQLLPYLLDVRLVKCLLSLLPVVLLGVVRVFFAREQLMRIVDFFLLLCIHR